MQIEALEASGWRRLKALRLKALLDAPDAFATTHAEAEQLGDSDWQAQLDSLATYIACLNGVDVGMARGAIDQTDPQQAYLVSMWVAPEARGQRIADALVQAVIDWAKASGHQRLLLDVADANLAAVALYERMGFEPTGETGSLPAPRTHVKEHQRALDLSR